MPTSRIKTTSLLLFFISLLRAQPGCPDPLATNFNPVAAQNDGSCLYPFTSYAPAFKANLGSELKEISGLHRAKGEWWAHNDSGFDPEFFSINPVTGTVLKKIALKDAHNRDWEDLCSDDANLYFADLGNNNNDRENLGIYRVPFNAIGNGNNQTINASEYTFLPFAYPEQVDFSTVVEDSTVFDCEAMLYAQNKLHLFTKNRKEYKTTHYTINPSTGDIQNIETFDTQGLITGASLSSDGKLIALVGYDLRGLPTVFCWLLWDWPSGSDDFFSGNKRRIELGSAFTVGQVESIGFESKRSGYIANERTEYGNILFVQQRTWAFDFSTWVPETVPTNSPDLPGNRLRVFPNPCSGVLFLSSDFSTTEGVTLEIINSVGMTVRVVQGLPERIDLSTLAGGLYTLKVRWSDGVQSTHKLIRI